MIDFSESIQIFSIFFTFIKIHFNSINRKILVCDMKCCYKNTKIREVTFIVQNFQKQKNFLIHMNFEKSINSFEIKTDYVRNNFFFCNSSTIVRHHHYAKFDIFYMVDF